MVDIGEAMFLSFNPRDGTFMRDVYKNMLGLYGDVPMRYHLVEIIMCDASNFRLSRNRCNFQNLYGDSVIFEASLHNNALVLDFF